MWSPPFGSFWSVKYLNFEQKLLIRTNHPTFLENRHPEVTKNPYYVLSLSSWTKLPSSTTPATCQVNRHYLNYAHGPPQKEIE